MKKSNINYSIILFMLLLLTSIFLEKYIYIAHNLNVNVGLLVYQFTFFLLIIMYNKNNIKYSKQCLFSSFILLLVFYLIASILNTIDSVTSSQVISNSLREIFTPNSFIIGSKFIYYPNISIILTFAVIYFISHYIFITIYEALLSISNNLIAFILSLLIGFILDQLLFVPLASIPHLMDGTLQYNELIKLMTGNFIIVIFSSVLMLIIYSIAYKKMKN